ncbi:MAG: ABC transporter ATP-binding protein [Oscillospiraceae bacterium]|nr:ABC transporter ATP-binding protein [Oscillospiraceae bacterium]
MKNKHKQNKQPFPPPVGKDKFSNEEIKALQNAGLNTDGIIYSCKGDMDGDMNFCDAWIWFNSEKLYIAFGSVEIKQTKNQKKRIEPKIEITETAEFSLTEAYKLSYDRFVSTGRLYIEKDGKIKFALGFSISKIGGIDNLSKAFNSYIQTGTAEIPSEEEEKKEGHCKKCGAPCPPDKEFCRKHNKNSKTAVRLFSFFGGYIPQIIVILLVMLSGSAISVFMPQLSTRRLFDNVLSENSGFTPEEMMKALVVLVLSIFGIKLLNTVLTSFRQYIQGSLMPSVVYDIKVKIFKAMQRLSVGFYSSKQTGSLMERVMRDANNIYWFFVDGVPGLIIEIATVIGVMTAMFIMSPRLSFLVLFLLPIVFILLYLGEKLFRTMHHRVWIYNSKLSSLVSDNVNGQREIKAFAKEDDEYERLSKVSKGFRDAELKLALTEATVFPIAEITVIILTAVVLGMGGVMVAKGQMTTGTLLSYIVYLEMLREPFDFLSWVSNWWSRCADSAQRVFEIVDSNAEITEKENAVELKDFKGNIEISKLDFEYEPARPIIKDFNLKINAGQMLGIVGKTGAGKSTIANLIARLYDPKKGFIKLDGVDLKDISFNSLRSNIGIVSQDIYIFMGTVADNIRYAKPDASMDEVIAAAKAASAHDFIMKLPDAYETYIGASGQKLSGGEKQRISIARTIMQNPKILILDEATAAMDTETERNIQNSLTRLKAGRTTLAIAHRLSTLRDADFLAVINEGTLVEYGTFTDLIKQKGEFYKQYKLQSEALKAAGILDDGGSSNQNDEESEE